MLRQDRLVELVAMLVDGLEAVPDADIQRAMPPTIGAAVGMLRRFRVDLIGDVRRSAIASLRDLPAMCEADPERAQRILDRTIGVVAWLDDQTDEPPAPSLS